MILNINLKNIILEGGHRQLWHSLSDKTLEACKNADAILLGAIGGPKWTNPNNRPEHGLLKLRKSLNLYANIRPTIVTEGQVTFLL